MRNQSSSLTQCQGLYRKTCNVKEKSKANLCQDTVIIQISANLIGFVLEQEDVSLIPTNIETFLFIFNYQL